MTTKSSRRLLHLVYSHYESDPRTRRQAEALRDAGWEVDIVCLARPEDPPAFTLDGVRVKTVQINRYRGKSVLSYLRSYGTFMARAMRQMSFFGKPYDLVHVHSLPDFIVHAARPSRWRGAAVLLDIHDLVPELFIERFGSDRKVVYQIVKWAERSNCAAAHHIITANEQFRERLVARGVPGERISINLNLPDETVFWREDPPPAPECPTLSYHGTLVPRYGPDILLEAAALLAPRFPDLQVRIVGDGDQKGELLERAARPDLEGRVYISPERVSVDRIPEELGPVTVGVVANRVEGFTRLVLPTTLLEYLAPGIPPVAINSETLEFYFEPGELVTVPGTDPRVMADALAPLLENPEERDRVLQAGRRFFERHVWTRERQALVDLSERLVAGRRGSRS
jgi:glycosyltransferase involved in cell wall biosynthesis